MADDLARRDFSINAMAFPLSRSESGLLDPHGGLADLADGLVRVLHPASFVAIPPECSGGALRLRRGSRWNRVHLNA